MTFGSSCAMPPGPETSPVSGETCRPSSSNPLRERAHEDVITISGFDQYFDYASRAQLNKCMDHEVRNESVKLGG